MTTFAEALIELREMRRLNKNQLARKAGLASSTIKMLETSRRTNPQCSTLAKLSEALGVSADNFLIKAGMMTEQPFIDPGRLMPKEQAIINAIRAIESPKLRRHAIDAMLQIAEGMREVTT